MELPTEFAHFVGAYLDLTYEKYKILANTYAQRLQYIQMDQTTLRSILQTVTRIRKHIDIRPCENELVPNDMSILKYSPDLQILDGTIYVQYSGLAGLAKFLSTHSAIVQLHFNIGANIDVIRDEILQRICALYTQNFTAKFNGGSIKLSFEGQMATYSTDDLLALQLRNTPIIKFDHLTKNLNIFDRELYPKYTNLLRVIGDIFVWTGREIQLGDIICTNMEPRIKGIAILCNRVAHADLRGTSYVLPFDIEDVEWMMKEGREFENIGIYVTYGMRKRVENIEVKNKFLFFSDWSVQVEYQDYVKPNVDFTKV